MPVTGTLELNTILMLENYLFLALLVIKMNC